MKKVTVQLKSVSPYSQSKHYIIEKLDKELPADYEKRTFMHRLHVDKDGIVFIPPMALKNCLAEAAKYLSIQIKGKGKATYTKHFEAGVMVMDPVPLGIHIDDIESEALFVPSDGQRGGKKRVIKYFPYIPEWKGEAIFYILDETITKEVFQHHLTEAGRFIGIGRFRPRNNGFYGRFEITKITFGK